MSFPPQPHVVSTNFNINLKKGSIGMHPPEKSHDACHSEIYRITVIWSLGLSAPLPSSPFMKPQTDYIHPHRFLHGLGERKQLKRWCNAHGHTSTMWQAYLFLSKGRKNRIYMRHNFMQCFYSSQPLKEQI